MLLRPQTQARLEWYAKEAAPREAVGLLDANGRIYLLKNISESPENSFLVDKQEILHVIEKQDFIGPLTHVTLWHSHPGGLEGPSRVDMQNRTQFSHHLVVTLLSGRASFTWY